MVAGFGWGRRGLGRMRRIGEGDEGRMMCRVDVNRVRGRGEDGVLGGR